MSRLVGIIGGSGLDDLSLTLTQQFEQPTPFGAVNCKEYSSNNQTVIFVARHGSEHALAPHKVNYRANIWAMRSLNVSQVIAFNVVGGIEASMRPNTLLLPNQLIDYTWGREHTYYDDNQYQGLSDLDHIDFSEPITASLHLALTRCLSDLSVVSYGVYGVTQGPRLETSAEITRLKHDGCDVVGMTAMPEAALARELQLPYAMISYVVNWAAGLEDKPISIDEIMKNIATARSCFHNCIARLSDL